MLVPVSHDHFHRMKQDTWDLFKFDVNTVTVTAPSALQTECFRLQQKN